MDPDSPSPVKDNTSSDKSNVEHEAMRSSMITIAHAAKSSSSNFRQGLPEDSSIHGSKRPSQDDINDQDIDGNNQCSPEAGINQEEAEKHVDREELSTRRRVKAKLGTIDTTFSLADPKAFPAPNSTPRSFNSEDGSFFLERTIPPMYKQASIYEKANPFKSSLSIGIPKSPAKINPYAGQSPNGNPFVMKSPHSTCSSNDSSKVSPRSNFNYPSSINSASSSPRPTFNGFLDLRSKLSPSVHIDGKQASKT